MIGNASVKPSAVLGLGTNDATPHNVLEQLIAGLFERRRLRNHSLTT